MRAIAFTALALLLCTLAQAKVESVAEFNAFKTKFGKQYASPAEEAKRFKIFVENMEKAKKQMELNPHATFGMNVFSDMSAAEFKSRHNAEKVYAAAQKHSHKLETIEYTAEERLAVKGRAQDWRPKGAVTPVKNQGDCGSCWSFSTTGGIEGQWFLAGNTLTSLSEQELVSCDTIDSGCNGGLMDNAFTWLLTTQNGSIVTEASYPYVSGAGAVPSCSLANTAFGARINGFKNIAKNEDDMANFVFTGGPLSIAVYAETWQTYTGGIVTNCPQDQLDHGVLIVGFDDTNNPPYWIIKNSWGPTWGESGYIRVEKGTGQCNIGTYQTTSIVNGSAPVTPTPAGPTNAPPAPIGTTFVQKTCTDRNCQKCSEIKLPQKTCIKGSTGSYTAQCATDALIITAFNSLDCSGSGSITANPINTCDIVFEASGNEHFVMNECRKSTPPQPPAPPAPTSAPATSAPAQATFTQETCLDAACSQSCQQQTFPQNTCLNLSGGGTAIATCTSTALQLTVFSASSNCTGASQTASQPINTCEQDNQGTFFENICSGTGKGKSLSAAAVRHSVKKH